MMTGTPSNGVTLLQAAHPVVAIDREAKTVTTGKDV